VGILLGLPPTPGAAHSDGGSGFCAYVTNLQSTTVHVVDPSVRSIEETLGGLTNPRAIAVTPDRSRAFVIEHGSFRVKVLDTRDHSVVATIPLGTPGQAADGREVAISPDGRFAYVTQEFFSNVSVIDVTTGVVVGVVQPGSRPRGVAVTPDGTHLYVANSAGGTVAVVDPASLTVETTIDVGGSPYGVAISPDGTRAYVASGPTHSVSVIDTASRTLLATISVPGTARWVAVSPDGARVYVTLPEDTWGVFNPQRLVGVIDTTSNTLVDTITVGVQPQNVEFTRDGARAFVTNFASGTLSEIDVATGNVVGTSPCGPTPVGLAVIERQPVNADAGPDVEMSPAQLESALLVGTAATPHPEPLLYRWFEGGVPLSDAAVVVAGQCPLALSVLDSSALGEHVLTLEASGFCSRTRDTMRLTIRRFPPVAAPAGSGSYPLGETFLVGGDVSDIDGDLLEYEWRAGSEVLARGSVNATVGGAPVALPMHLIATTSLGAGVHELELAVDDGGGEIVASIVVEVLAVDVVAPTLAPLASTTLLWPPNHKMVEVSIETHALDDSGGPVTLDVEVSSDEPADGAGDGATASDHEVLDVDSETGVVRVRLRAERSGKGDGRVYTVRIAGTDASGNSSVALVEIRAPKSQGKG
jgi:YVTN family beta-propeller protein